MAKLGAVCAVCRHPKASQINKALRNGACVPDLATTYDLSRTTLYRHRKHMDERDPEKKEKAFADKTSIERCDEMEKIARHLLVQATESGDARTAVSLIKAANESIALSSKLRGEMSGRPSASQGPTWEGFNRFVDLLIGNLTPDARTIVLAALDGMRSEYAEDDAAGAINP